MLKNIVKKVLLIKPSPLKDYQYSIDKVDTGLIHGWAKNIKLPNHSPVVDVYADGVLVWQTKANLQRSDLIENGIGGFAFRLSPDASVLTKSVGHIDIFIDGHRVNKEPYAFQLDPVDAAKSASPESNDQALKFTLQDFRYSVDSVSGDKVRGWIKIKNDSEKRVDVELRHESKVLASGCANLYRRDLKAAQIGDGRYGFELKPDLTLFPLLEVDATLFANGVELKGDTLSIKVTEQEITRAKFESEFAPELAKFNVLMESELSRVESEISQLGDGEANQEHALRYLLSSVVELNVRTKVIEESMVKYISSTKEK